MSRLVEQTMAVLVRKGSINLDEFQELVRATAEERGKDLGESLPQGWTEKFVPFVRMEGLGVTTVAMVTVWSPHEGDAIFAAIRRAVTRWVGTTDQGKHAWSGTCEDFNVGDLLAERYLREEALSRLLREEGVFIADGVIADASQAFVFDHVLADKDDPAVQAALQED